MHCSYTTGRFSNTQEFAARRNTFQLRASSECKCCHGHEKSLPEIYYKLYIFFGRVSRERKIRVHPKVSARFSTHPVFCARCGRGARVPRGNMQKSGTHPRTTGASKSGDTDLLDTLLSPAGAPPRRAWRVEILKIPESRES